MRLRKKLTVWWGKVSSFIDQAPRYIPYLSNVRPVPSSWNCVFFCTYRKLVNNSWIQSKRSTPAPQLVVWWMSLWCILFMSCIPIWTLLWKEHSCKCKLIFDNRLARRKQTGTLVSLREQLCILLAFSTDSLTCGFYVLGDWCRCSDRKARHRKNCEILWPWKLPDFPSLLLQF